MDVKARKSFMQQTDKSKLLSKNRSQGVARVEQGTNRLSKAEQKTISKSTLTKSNQETNTENRDLVKNQAITLSIYFTMY